MHPYWQRLRELVVAEDGPTATEYAVMLALIIVICLVAIGALGRTVNQIFIDVVTAIIGQRAN